MVLVMVWYGETGWWTPRLLDAYFASDSFDNIVIKYISHDSNYSHKTNIRSLHCIFSNITRFWKRNNLVVVNKCFSNIYVLRKEEESIHNTPNHVFMCKF